MTLPDWLILSAYLIGMVGMCVRIGRGQKNPDDYYLAGRRIGPYPVAFSILATQISAISLVGGPAFVAARTGGGLIWLQYELAVPLAMLVLLAVLVPVYHAARVTSIYELLEQRFGPGVRRTVSGVFLISRGLANAVALYAASLVVAVLLDIPLIWAMLAMGGVALVYTAIGGIRADIYTDIIQLFLLWASTLACIGITLYLIGGFSGLSAVPEDRLRILDFSRHGLGDGVTYSFWPMVLGGFFLYLSYYGCDQSQAQRLMTTRTPGDAQRALVLNGLLRFPLALTYCTFGVMLSAFLIHRPDFAAMIPSDRPDELVPLFLLHHVPSGLRGLIVAGIVAAAMSSFDSAFNSLSAATVKDFIDPFFKIPSNERRHLWLCRLWTVFWGIFCIGAAVLFSRSSDTVIEAVNKVGSAFYGPILAVFLLALLRRRPASSWVLAGLAGGVAVNLVLWLFVPQVSWLWWNPIGFVCAFLPAWTMRQETAADLSVQPLWARSSIGLLAGAFGLLLFLSLMFEWVAR